VELVITEVERGVDGFEWFKVNIDLLFLSFIRNDCSTIHDETVFGAFIVEFETLLGGCDGSEDGETVYARFDVGCGTVFVGKHFVDAGDLIAGGDDEGDHGGSISACCLKVFDQFFYLEHFDLLICVTILCHDGEFDV